MYVATEYWLGFFDTEHLHPVLKPLVTAYKELAERTAQGPENQSTTEAVKMLVRAKDEACRALVADGALNARLDILKEVITSHPDKVLGEDDAPCPAKLAGIYPCGNKGRHTRHSYQYRTDNA